MAEAPDQAPDGTPVGAGSAPSTYEVRRGADGVFAFTTRNVRYEPFGEVVDGAMAPRLLTVVTTALSLTSSDGARGHVAVTLDDVSGPSPRRLSAFSDPGTGGERVGAHLFSTTASGCCGGPHVHRVRVLGSGRSLFRATGPGPTGISAFLVARERPVTRRWAAYDGAPGAWPGDHPDDAAAGVVGHLLYGDDAGTVGRLGLRFTGTAEGGAEAVALGMAHDAALAWVRPGQSPAAGSADAPVVLLTPEDGRPVAGVGGFSLRLLGSDDETVAEIPVEDDRLLPERATLAAGYAFVPDPAAPSARP